VRSHVVAEGARPPLADRLLIDADWCDVELGSGTRIPSVLREAAGEITRLMTVTAEGMGTDFPHSLADSLREDARRTTDPVAARRLLSAADDVERMYRWWTERLRAVLGPSPTEQETP
jgi:hypothetical protein